MPDAFVRAGAALPRLAAALVHADPQAQEGTDHHAALGSHR
jgi:hypothetical protein